MTHGHAHRYKGRWACSPTYYSWRAMKQRCLNPRNHNYPGYGGRGITVCKRWLKFENFLADMGERPAGMTLDRRNNDKGYCKRNCRWESRKVQSNNQRVRKDAVFYLGKRPSEWAIIWGCTRHAATMRIKRSRNCFQNNSCQEFTT